MKIKASVAAAVMITALLSGCSAYKTVDIDSNNQAYERVLYSDGDVVTDEDDFDDFFEEEEPESKKPAQKKEEKKKDEKKTEEKSAESKKPESSGSSSQTRSEPVYSSRYTASYERTTRETHTEERRSGTSDRSKTESSSASRSSSAASEKEKDNTRRGPEYGVFTEYDISYYANGVFIDLDDAEVYVRRVMGEPEEEIPNEDGSEKKLVYPDCEMTFKKQPLYDEYYLDNIFVGYDSLYETEKIIGTESPVGRVITAFGSPTQIIFRESQARSEDGPELPERSGDPEEEQTPAQTDTESTDPGSTDPEAEPEDTEQDADTETDTDTDTERESDTDIEEPSPAVIDMIYVYTLDGVSLRLNFSGGKVYSMEYCRAD